MVIRMQLGQDVEDKIFVEPEGIEFESEVTVAHWQLRDLMCCPKTPDELYFIRSNNIMKLNTSTKETKIAHKLHFEPTSIAVRGNYLAAGGQASQLVIKNIDNDRILFDGTVGSSINNAIFIGPCGDDERIFVSNNDDTIKVFKLPDMEHVVDLHCSTAVNSTAASPDGRFLVAAGDTNHVHLFSAQNSFSRIATLQDAKDSGFSCAWNGTSTQFACASQDGSVTVWDVRTLKPIAKFMSKQSRQRGACRIVKFTQNTPIDLMAFAEHQSYVHIVDARTFSLKQSIRAQPYHTEPNIAGLTFSPDETRLYFATESKISMHHVDILSRKSFPYGELF